MPLPRSTGLPKLDLRKDALHIARQRYLLLQCLGLFKQFLVAVCSGSCPNVGIGLMALMLLVSTFHLGDDRLGPMLEVRQRVFPR